MHRRLSRLVYSFGIIFASVTLLAFAIVFFSGSFVDATELSGKDAWSDQQRDQL